MRTYEGKQWVYTLNYDTGIYSKDMIMAIYEIEGKDYYKLTGHPYELFTEERLFWRFSDLKNFCLDNKIYMRKLEEDYIINRLKETYFDIKQEILKFKQENKDE